MPDKPAYKFIYLYVYIYNYNVIYIYIYLHNRFDSGDKHQFINRGTCCDVYDGCGVQQTKDSPMNDDFRLQNHSKIKLVASGNPVINWF